MPPNILLILSDEHAPQTIGCMGADFARTPAMDRLAAEGCTFTNAYCNFALCVPSRNSLMTGLLPGRIRAYDNGSPVDSALPTWAHLTRRAGYRTILDGKMHFQGPDQLHGFEEHWHEPRYRIHGYHWGDERPNCTGYRAWENNTILQPGQTHRHLDTDLARIDAAVEFLDTYAHDRPFCLTVGLIYPHYPQVCTAEAYARYADAAIPPPVPREHLHPRNRKWSDEVWGFDRFAPATVAESRRVYCAMVSMVDDWIGRIMTTLDRNGLADDTVVIYTSDHGDMWGEHDLWGKNLFYEESARVPFIVRAPGQAVPAGRRIDTPVSLVDLLPTLRDIAGVRDWDLPTDGRSLWPACQDREPLADQPVYCEYYASDTEGPERMVRYLQYKLNYYHRQGLELFDLAADPHELHDVADDPAYARIRAEMLAHCRRDWDPDALDADIRADQHRRVLLCQAEGTPEGG